jgi:hypothetical protein
MGASAVTIARSGLEDAIASAVSTTQKLGTIARVDWGQMMSALAMIPLGVATISIVLMMSWVALSSWIYFESIFRD